MKERLTQSLVDRSIIFVIFVEEILWWRRNWVLIKVLLLRVLKESQHQEFKSFILHCHLYRCNRAIHSVTHVCSQQGEDSFIQCISRVYILRAWCQQQFEWEDMLNLSESGKVSWNCDTRLTHELWLQHSDIYWWNWWNKHLNISSHWWNWVSEILNHC